MSKKHRGKHLPHCLSPVSAVPSPQLLHSLVDLTLFWLVGSMVFVSLGPGTPSFLHFDQNSAAGREGSSLSLLLHSLAHRKSCRSTVSSTGSPRSHPPREKKRVSFRSTESPLDSFSPWTVEEAWGLMIVLSPHWGQASTFQVVCSPNNLSKGSVGFCPSGCISFSWQVGGCFPGSCLLDCLFPFYIS